MGLQRNESNSGWYLVFIGKNHNAVQQSVARSRTDIDKNNVTTLADSQLCFIFFHNLSTSVYSAVMGLKL